MTRAEQAAELAGFIKMNSYDDGCPYYKELHYPERDCFIAGYETGERNTIYRACEWLKSNGYGEMLAKSLERAML